MSQPTPPDTTLLNVTTPTGLVVPITLDELRTEIGEPFAQAIDAIVLRKLRAALDATADSDVIGVGA